MAPDPLALPDDLPVPVDDGAAAHLLGSSVPSVPLPATDGSSVDLSTLTGRTVVYAFPRTGRPGDAPLVADWDSIPGARGCTPQACGFRDHHADLAAAGARVFGFSTQDTPYQQELVSRLRLPFALLSDSSLAFTQRASLPTFEVAGQILVKRLTVLIEDGVVTHLWYPVFPPDTHAETVLDYVRGLDYPPA